MRVTTEIRTNWAKVVTALFGEDAFQTGQDLPPFEAYLVRGKVHVLAGVLTETKEAVLTQAVQSFVDSGYLIDAAA